jgi:hypothetical protein
VSSEIIKVRPFEETYKLAEMCVAGGMFGDIKVETMMTLMTIADARGIHPIEAGMRYHVIKGKASMSAQAMLAEFQAVGGTVEWVTHTSKICVGIYTHQKYAPKGFECTTKIEDYQHIGTDPWKRYPERMLMNRNTANGVKAVAPGLALGMYETGEAEEIAMVSTPERAPQRAPIQDAETEQAPPRKTEKPVLPDDIESQIVECILNAKSLDEILQAKRLAKGYRATDEQISKIKRAEEEVSAAITSADGSTKFDRAGVGHTLDQILDELTRSPQNAAAWAMKATLTDDEQAAFDVAFREVQAKSP